MRHRHRWLPGTERAGGVAVMSSAVASVSRARNRCLLHKAGPFLRLDMGRLQRSFQRPDVFRAVGYVPIPVAISKRQGVPPGLRAVQVRAGDTPWQVVDCGPAGGLICVLCPVVPPAAELERLPHAELAALLAEAYQLIGQLRARVEHLERAAGKDSSASSRPPSPDSPYKKKPRDRSLREWAGGGRASSPASRGRR
jgi:uncharacterized protein DUF6444